MASLTQWTWVWVNSGSWWWTGRCCNSWGHKESDMTERLNWTELNGDADLKHRLVDTVGEGEGGTNWEWNWKIYITISKIDSLRKFAVWCREFKSGALRQPRGVGRGGRWDRGSGGRGHMYTYGRFILIYDRTQLTQYCKATILKLNKKYQDDDFLKQIKFFVLVLFLVCLLQRSF